MVGTGETNRLYFDLASNAKMHTWKKYRERELKLELLFFKQKNELVDSVLVTSYVTHPSTNRREKFHQMWQPKYAVFWPLLLPTFGLSLLGVGKKWGLFHKTSIYVIYGKTDVK